VYRALIRGLIYPEARNVRGLGLEPLFERAFERGTIDETFGRSNRERDPGSYHALLTPALQYYRRLRDRDAGEDVIQELLDWIEGNTLSGQDHLKNRLRRAVGRLTHPIWALPDFRTYYHVYAYLLDGIALLARAAGYSGLIVMIDEAERYDLLSLEDQGFAVELMGALFSASSEELDRRPIRLGKGGHRAFQDLPSRFGTERCLCPMMAVTPGTEGEAVVKRLLKDAPYLLALTPLTPKDFALLALKIIDIYAIAFPAFVPAGDDRRRWALDLGERIRGLVEMDELRTPRDTLQLLVAVLDAARTNVPVVDPMQIRMTS
ncbi:MAG: hypothetical protein H6834_14640, partial [Planctomycetes bacterium]|nr:hypothetical protein [Planctomycetota bacterium]